MSAVKGRDPGGFVVADCIQCGECTSSCPRHRFDPAFNPRRWMGRLRLLPLDTLTQDRSAWACLKCFRCASVCRRKLSVGDELIKVRQEVMRSQLYSDPATRHTKAFLDDIRKTGKLDEAFLPLKTLHHKVVKLTPLTLRVLMKGKMPKLMPKKIAGLQSLRDLYDQFA